MSNGYVFISPCNAFQFTNASSNDFLFYPQSNSQKLLLGVNTNAVANITLSSNLTSFNGNIATNDMISFKGLQIAESDGTHMNFTQTSIQGFSNDSNGVVFSIAGNTSNNYFRFMASNTEIAKLSGDGNFVVGTSNTPGYISASNLHMFRNRIMNGDMRIDQRSNGSSYAVNANAAIVSVYCVDRWYLYNRSQNAVQINYSASQVAASVSQFRNALQATVITTGAVATNDAQFFGQKIEGLNLYDLAWGTASAAPVTISFWARASIAGTYSLALRSLNLQSTYMTPFVLNTANAWQYVSKTIPGPTTGTWANDTGGTLEAMIVLACGSGSLSSASNAWQGVTGSGMPLTATENVNLTGTANASFQFTGFQLEKGSMATPFETRSYATELALCQRYYEDNRTNIAHQMVNVGTWYPTPEGGGPLAGYVSPYIYYKVTKRINPTITYVNDATTGSWYNTWNSPSAKCSTSNGFQVYFASAGTQTSWAQGGWVANAEI